jgi:FkbM family methyltransferase
MGSYNLCKMETAEPVNLFDKIGWRLNLLKPDPFFNRYVGLSHRLLPFFLLNGRYWRRFEDKVRMGQGSAYRFTYDRFKIYSPSFREEDAAFNSVRFEEVFMQCIWESIFERIYFLGEAGIDAGDTVFDIGASVGTFSLVAASMAGEDGRVYAFEPTESTFTALKTNIETNRASNIYAFKKGVFSENRSLLFDERKGPFTTNRIVDQKSTTDKSGFEKSTIESVTLDSFAITHTIGKVDFIKIDVEGYAKEVLDGAKGLLERFKPKLAIACYHDRENGEEILRCAMSANGKYRSIGTKNGVLFVV